jgi:DNA-binding CsgD family transcriptional regulator/ligand-binding sensor protein
MIWGIMEEEKWNMCLRIWGEFRKMNQVEISKCEKWIKTNGKRKLQSFQDSFADLLNISLGIISLEGKALTVWSNSSLFCHCIIKSNRERCRREKQCIIDYVLKKGETIRYTCYMGVTYFAYPIFCNKDIVAICLGGGIYLEENKELSNSKITENIPVFNEIKLNDSIKLLENVFNLLNVKEEISFAEENKRDEIRQEISFLEKELSRRELEIVKLINSGLLNKEISLELNISEKTVKTHITNILRKLNMKNRTQIIILCKNSIINDLGERCVNS